MISEGIADAWPDEVLAASGKFQLGDLIQSPPICYGADNRFPLWQGAEANRSGAGIVELHNDALPQFGIITSQTCDIAERGTTEQPWIQVSPVYQLDSEEGLGGRIFLHRLSAPRFAGEIWVADFRLEVPLEKSVLVGREPMHGFADEQGAIEFAEKLGRRRDRAALADAVNDVLYRRLSKLMSNNRAKAKRIFETIHGVGLAIAEGTRLEPIAVQAHFITVTGAVDEQAEEWFERWWDSAHHEAAESDPSLNLLPNVYHDGARMDLTTYDELIPLGWRP